MLFQDDGRYERRFEAIGRCVPERAVKTSQSFAVLFAIIGERPNKFLCLARCPDLLNDLPLFAREGFTRGQFVRRLQCDFPAAQAF